MVASEVEKLGVELNSFICIVFFCISDFKNRLKPRKKELSSALDDRTFLIVTEVVPKQTHSVISLDLNVDDKIFSNPARKIRGHDKPLSPMNWLEPLNILISSQLTDNVPKEFDLRICPKCM